MTSNTRDADKIVMNALQIVALSRLRPLVHGQRRQQLLMPRLP